MSSDLTEQTITEAVQRSFDGSPTSASGICS